MLNLNYNLLRTGSYLTKALQIELDSRGISYNSGRCDDPNTESQTTFHFFQPGGNQSPSTCTVLFHGTGNDALFCWEDLILELLQSGRAVFTFDLPGHGQNSSTVLSEETLARCGHFLPTLLPKLMPTMQRTEAIGYSLGALAALQSTAHGTMPWHALIMMALPQHVELSSAFIGVEALSFFHKAWWSQLRRHGWDASFPAFGTIRRSRFPIRVASDIGMNYPQFVEYLLGKIDVKATLRRLHIPVLLVYGSRDYLARAAYGLELSDDCRLVQGANHFLLPLVAETRALLIPWLLTSQRHPAGR